MSSPRPRWLIGRRTLLRGAGVSMALPLLEQMLPSDRAAYAAGPKRFVTLFKPCGNHLQTFFPSGTFTFTPALESLSAVKEHVTLINGLHNKAAEKNTNAHMAGVAAFLTQINPPSGGGGKMSISIDQVIANAWKGQTAFSSLQFGGNAPSGALGDKLRSGASEYEGYPPKWGATNSFDAAGQPIPTEINPQVAFDRLFAGAAPAPSPTPPPTGTPTGPDPATVAAQKRITYKRSVLDAVNQQAKALQAKLGTADKQRLDGYLTSVNELDNRLRLMVPTTGTGPGTGTGTVTPPITQGCQPGTRPTAAQAHQDRVRAFLDISALALQCDRTRVITFMMGEAESEAAFPFLNLPSDTGSDKGHHGVSHHGTNSSLLSAFQRIDKWYTEQVAYFASKLKSMQEGTGSVLDSTIVFHGSEVGDGDAHSFGNVPVVVIGNAGGALTAGRYVNVANRPLADLYLSFLQMLGVSGTSSFGISTGPLSLS